MFNDDISHSDHPEDSFMSNMNKTHNTHILKTFLENHVNDMHPRGLDMSVDQNSVLSNDSTSHDVNQTVLVHNILELLRNQSQNGMTVEQIGDVEIVTSRPVTNNSSSFLDIDSAHKINVDNILELLRNHSQNGMTVEKIGDDETVTSEPVTNNSTSFRDIDSTDQINVGRKEDTKISQSADDQKELSSQSNRFGFRTG